MCTDCLKFQHQQNQLLNAVAEATDPLSLLHSLVSILIPEAASKADVAMRADEHEN